MKITLEFNSDADTAVQYAEAGRMLLALAGVSAEGNPQESSDPTGLPAPQRLVSEEKEGPSEAEVARTLAEDKRAIADALEQAGFTVPEAPRAEPAPVTKPEPAPVTKPEPAEGKTRTRRTKAQMDAYRAALAAGKSEAEAEAISYSIPREDAAPKSEAKSASDSFFDDPEPEPNITASPEDRVDPSEVITKEDIPKLLRRVAVLPPGDANRAYANKWIVQLLESKYGVRGTVNLKPDQYAPFYHEVRAELDRLGV